MGLDQCAYTRPDDQEPSEAPTQFIWRKHAKLQEFMEQLYVERTGSPADELNCGELKLLTEDIERLKQLVENDDLPTSVGGFFYGHQFQHQSAAEYREQDLEFCAWALNTIKAGNRVYFSCWW